MAAIGEAVKSAERVRRLDRLGRGSYRRDADIGWHLRRGASQGEDDMAGKFEAVRETMSPVEKLVAEDLRGVTTDGNARPGLFPVRKTGVSTAPIVEAAQQLLDGLNGHQFRKIRYPVDSDEWRWWNNTSGNDYRSG